MDPPESRSVWLHGPAADLSLGAGLAYWVAFALLILSATEMRAVFPPWILLVAVVFLSMPHYGATLLRVYERREDRRAYVLFATYSTLAIVALFLWSAYSVRVGAILFTVYLTWSPWHYTGQNYGIAMMFLGRAGVVVAPSTKRLLYASFVISYLITLLFIHGGATFIPYSEQVTQFVSLNINAILADILIFALLLAYVSSVCSLAFLLLRAGGRRAVPALVLVLTQGLWFVVPAAIRNWFPVSQVLIFNSGWAVYAFSWVAIGHAIQYLWITSYFALASKRTGSRARFYGKALLVGCAIWTVPALFLAPGAFGRLPYDVGLAAALAAAVNLHHFILDGAIWKLRDSRIAQILVRTTESAGSVPIGLHPQRWGWGGRAVALAGAASLMISVAGIVETEFGLERSLAVNDFERAGTAADRMAWLGQDSPSTRITIGRLALAKGELEFATRHLERGIRVFPTSDGWMALGEVRMADLDTSAAIDAYDRSLVLRPENRLAYLLLAVAYVDIGRLGQAREMLQFDLQRTSEPSLRARRVRAVLKRELSGAI